MFPQWPYFEQQKYSPVGSHWAGVPSGNSALTPHLPSNRKLWLLSISLSVTSENEETWLEVRWWIALRLKVILQSKDKK